MDTTTVMLVIGAAVALLVGIFVLSTVISSVTLPSITSVNESINFAANYTAYAPANTYFLNITHLYSNASRADDCWSIHGPGGTNRIIVNSSGFALKTNGTSGNCSSAGGYNLTIGVKYVDYTYQLTAANTTFSSVLTTVFNGINLLAVALIVVAAATILAYFGFGRTNE